MKKLYRSAFTVDVEDGVSIAMRDVFSKKVEQTDRVVTHTTRILDLLEEYETKATFFVLGEVAEKFPELVRSISMKGHELGVHGYHHLQFFRMNPKEAYRELSEAKKLIEDLSGQQVLGHRAPAFSITPETEWGLDVIADVGFTYDSSIMPVRGRRYGWSGFSKEITTVQTPAGSQIIEVPLSVAPFLGREIPVCGGGYLRLFPFGFTKRMFEKIAKKRPVILYMHPYELDTKPYPDYYFEELNDAGFLKRNKMKSAWINRKTVFSKLEKLLECYQFVPVKDLIEDNKPEPEHSEI